MKEQLTGVQNYQEAREVIINNCSQLTAAVGGSHSCFRIDLPVGSNMRFDFPSRVYGKLVLPQGEYEAVKVVLGNGKGAEPAACSFPPLCFVDISGDALEMEMINEENTTMEGNGTAGGKYGGN